MSSRAAASVRSMSTVEGSAAPCMRVAGFERKFWTMISWMLPWRSCTSRSARSASTRSSGVSPMPMRMPLVIATPSSPAVSSVARRCSGRLLVVPSCGPPFSCSRGLALSSMMPMLAFHGAIAAISSRLSKPQFVWGRRPVSSSTSFETAATYSGVEP